jgi:urease accessory protein
MDDKETYLLLVLSDSNLPTGSFVASAGLESTATHALFHATGSAASATGTGTIGNTVTPTSSILAFLRNSIDTYARSALPFSRDAHRITTAYTNANGDITQQLDLDGALEALGRIDALYDACTLNHVARRASCAQGVALLTLYARGFTCPPFLALATPQGVDDLDEQERDRECRAGALVAALKLRVRRGGESDDGALGHLPVCWGVLAGALGLSVGE